MSPKSKKRFSSYSKTIKRLLLAIVFVVILPLHLLIYYVFNLNIFRITDIKITYLVNVDKVIFRKGVAVSIYNEDNVDISVDCSRSQNCVRYNDSIIYKTCNIGERQIIEIYPNNKKAVTTDMLTLKNDNIAIVFEKHNIYILNKHKNEYFRICREEP